MPPGTSACASPLTLTVSLTLSLTLLLLLRSCMRQRGAAMATLSLIKAFLWMISIVVAAVWSTSLWVLARFISAVVS